MTIKNLIPQLLERGRIKIGEKGEIKNSAQGIEFVHPKKLDHFLLTTMERDAAGRLMPDLELMRRFAPADGKLAEIPVKLLFNDPEINFQTRYACYTGNHLWCFGDGESGQRLEEDGKYHPHQCPCLRLDHNYAGKDRCKPNGTLQVLLQGVDRIGGVWKFRTTSWNSVNSIMSSLKLIQAITGGILAGIPLRLVLRPKTVKVSGTGDKMVIFVVNLEFPGTEQELAQIAYDLAWQRAEHKARVDQIEAETRRALEQLAETPEEMREVQEEFYPEGVVLASNPSGKSLTLEGKKSASSPCLGPESGPFLSESKTQDGLTFNPLTPAEFEMVPLTWEPPAEETGIQPNYGVLAQISEGYGGSEPGVKGSVKPTAAERRRRSENKKDQPPVPQITGQEVEGKPQLF